MFEPPGTEVDPRRSLSRFDLNAAIEIEIAELTETQERRHEIDVALAASDVLDLLEAQDHRLAAVEHHAIVDVEFGESVFVLLFALGGSRLLRRFRRALLFLVFLVERLLSLLGRLLNERV